MKILYTTAEIRRKITEILAHSKGRRVVVSAFVGAGSEVYLPKPQGLELICWPQPGSTNPNTIRELIQRGVNVSFAQKMHIKLYWTSDLGSIITSANLSSNALGSGGQLELGAFLQPGQVNIEKILTHIDAKPVTKTSLHNLELAHHEYIKHNPQEHITTSRTRRFNNWFEQKPKEPWKFAVWDTSNIQLSSRAKNLLTEEFGNSRCHEWMSADRNDFSDNDWVLCLRETPKRLGHASWMFVHHAVQVPVAERKKRNDGYPIQIIQVSSLKLYEKPPFSLADKKIQQAIKMAYKKVQPSDGKPGAAFINAIHNFYNDKS
jgi:hypothetical protein